jgi:hypothetical protein
LKRLTLILIAIVACLGAWGQDSAAVKSNVALDTVIHMPGGTQIISESHQRTMPTHDYWKPNPTKSVWLAAIVPGLGQIYNRSYWKLPILYGGLMGCAYAISWNNARYQDYHQAYRDILNDKELSTDPNRSYNAMLPKGYTVESMGGRAYYTKVLKDKQNTYHRYRDLSIVITVAVYALSIVDAFVDAQLFDFDISPDLSLNVEPQIYYDIQHERQHSAEIKLALTIK